MKNNNLERYIIQKTVFANSAKEALKKEKNVSDVFVDNKWKELKDKKFFDTEPIKGFNK